MKITRVLASFLLVSAIALPVYAGAEKDALRNNLRVVLASQRTELETFKSTQARQLKDAREANKTELDRVKTQQKTEIDNIRSNNRNSLAQLKQNQKVTTDNIRAQIANAK